MTETTHPKAVIYCRHASANEAGIKQQEELCRDYAQQKGYDIAAVFQDNGVSGNTITRDGMDKLLAYLDGSEGQHVVLVDEIVRIARSAKAHYRLIDSFAEKGASYEVCS
jgi:DNA invertase Pin-like site-specific DNA recombinase